MTAAPFDTLKLARALREASFSTEQAEGAAYAIAEAVQTDLATKSDLREIKSDLREMELRLQTSMREMELRLDGKTAALGAELRGEIAATRAEIAGTKADIAGTKADIAGTKAEIAATKADILKWMFGAVGLQTLVILGAVITLMRYAKP